MSEEKTPFIAQTRLLDGFIKSQKPREDPIGVKVVVSVLRKRPELRRYFFASKPDSAWAEILWEEGFLGQAPEEPGVEDQKIRFRYWDVQEYLISVAKDVPEVAIGHILTLRGHAWYRGRALLAIQFFPE